jgi:hypothetical protein
MSELEKGSELDENQTAMEVKSEKELIEQPMHDEHAAQHVPEPVEDFSTKTKEELVEVAVQLANDEMAAAKHKVNALKDAFEHVLVGEREAALAEFIEQGGAKEDFKPAADKLEERFFAAIKKFNKRKAEFFEQQEKQRDDNFKVKHDILNELKDLIQNEENMQRAFELFHDLQARWRSTGAVPSGKVNDLWLTYQHYINKFYEQIKINRELQELDFRKNLEAKVTLCEKAEQLIIEPSLNKALSALHELQNKWRETGPVSREKKNEIWERFKAASDKIYERRREYFDELKQRYAENLQAKNELIQKAEDLAKAEPVKANDWIEIGKHIVELQNAWKKTGYADKKSNDEVWTKFRGICDGFFKRKNEYFTALKKEYAANLQAKTELCMQAEALIDNTDWKKTTDELKRLQQEWKNIGHVAEKQGQKVWERFRSACDKFFEKKNAHYKTLEGDYQENFVKKNALIEKAEQFVLGESTEEAMEQLKDMQREWSDIGMVPMEHKDTVYARFKAAIDKQFQAIRAVTKERFSSGYKPAYRAGKPGNESNDFKHKINQLTSEINTWENNLGFFARSKNADALKKEFEEKINNAREEIKRIKKQMEEMNKPPKEA